MRVDKSSIVNCVLFRILQIQSYFGVAMTKRQKRRQRLKKQSAKLERRLTHLQRRSDLLSRTRLILFALAGVGSGTIFLTLGPVVWVIGTSMVLIPFIIAVIIHRRVETAILRVQILQRIKHTHLARMDLAWDELPEEMPAPAWQDHPFALDLDLVGPRSLHRLLNTAVTTQGGERLRQWLMAKSPELSWIRQQQARVRALGAMLHFSDRIKVYTRQVLLSEEKWPADEMVAWVNQPTDLQKMRRKLFVLFGLVLLYVVLIVLAVLGIDSFHWWMLGFSLYAGMYILMGLRQVHSTFIEATELQDGLLALRPLFDYLETTPHATRPFIRDVCAPFLDEQERPSTQLKRLNWIFAGIGFSRNVLLSVILNLLLPWDLFFTYHLRKRQAVLAEQLPRWFDAIYELEALSALANFAYLNPDSTSYPRVRAAQGERPLLTATDIGHPMIPAAQRVCNDFAIPHTGSITIITGSNMAGKSSFLRALGINLVLAYAGGPVMAHNFDVVLLRIFTSIRVADSVTEGLSYFYAEVRRLQALLAAVEAEHERPLFFLIDEIFRGTNNQERLIGSRAYIETLAGSDSVGLIATHDLELVKLADAHPSIRNMHFRDDVQDGEMIFDYTLRPGPCPTTNALKIMRLAGLPVDGAADAAPVAVPPDHKQPGSKSEGR